MIKPKSRIPTLVQQIKNNYVEPEMKPLSKLLSFGNTKIGDDPWDNKIAIFNIGTATNCPSREQGICKIGEKCYALKAERQYPNVMRYRNAQALYWELSQPTQFYREFKKFIYDSSKVVKALRFNEAGDIKDLNDLLKMEKIANLLASDNIITYTYTANMELCKIFTDNYISERYLVINGSGFMADNEFTAVTKEVMLNNLGKNKICNNDCRTCNLCMIRGNKVINVLMH